MKVYVATVGVYDQSYVGGVYASPELAMAAHHVDGMVWTATTWAGPEDVPEKYRSQHSERYTTWENNQDWDAAVRIEERDLVDSGEAREADARQQQVYRDSDGGWDYVPLEAIGHELGQSAR